ncbi:hypothetical protein JA1_002002 [Spathaspora sp. JA1]|nr:hypothetical protein JA1_002002 [Spathaspora sp. JA1]
MHFHELPPEIVSIVIELLPNDIVEPIIHSNSWMAPFAFQKYYRKITVRDDPQQFNKSASYCGLQRPLANYSHKFVYPTGAFPSQLPEQPLINEVNMSGTISETCIFGSVYSLVRFINRHPEFLPDQITFFGIMLLLPLTYEFQSFIKNIPKIFLLELPSWDSQALEVRFEALTVLNKYRGNIYGEYYGELDTNNFIFPSDARHIIIPRARIQDFEEFFVLFPKIETLVVSNLLSCDTNLYPKSLKFVGSHTIKPLPKIEFPDTVTHCKIICGWADDDEAVDEAVDEDGQRNVWRERLDLSNCKNLQYFELSNEDSVTHPEIILPLGLQTLKVQDTYDVNKLYYGSVSLSRIELDGTFDVRLYHSLFYRAELPQTLKELYVTNSSINLGSYAFQDSLLPHPLVSGEYAFKIGNEFNLPANLEVLHLNCPSVAIDSSWKVPESVRELVLTRVVYFVDFPSLVLPKNLETLFIESIYGLLFDSFQGSGFVSFPKDLVSFTYYGKPIHNLETNLFQLPNLTNLKLASHGLEGFNEPFLINGISIGCSNFEHLENLQTLELDAIPIFGEINMKLPNSLRSFRCSMSEVKGFDKRFRFPSHLHELILEQTGIDLDILNNLPPTIEHLELLNCDTIMPKHLEMRAPHLRLLVINDSGIDQKTFEFFNFKKNYPKLQIIGFQDNKISEIDLSLFPASVANLSVYRNHAKIICGTNVYLPNLRNLELSENLVQDHYDNTKEKGEGEACKFVIPEGIECLKMRDCSITSSEFAVWPKELGSLNLMNNDISASDLGKLCEQYSKVKCFEGITVVRELWSESVFQLPSDAIQFIVDLLPRDILERLLEFNNWVSPYAFNKYYARIKLIDNPNQFNKSTSYGGVDRPEIVPLPVYTPYHSREEDVCIFGSLFSLSQFIRKNPEFIPTEVTLETLTSFVRLAYEYQHFLKKVTSIRLLQLDDSFQEAGIGGALTQSFKLLHRVFNNIHCEVFKPSAKLILDELDVPESILHIDIPSGEIQNFEEFLKQPYFIPQSKNFTIVSNYGLSTLLPDKTFLTRLEIVGFFSMKFYLDLFYEYEFPETLEEFYFENSNLFMDSTEHPEDVLPHPYLNDVFDLRINSKVKFPKTLKVLHLSCPFTAIDSSWKIPDTVKRLVLAHISYIVDLPGLILPSNLEYFFVEPIYGLISVNTTNSDIVKFPESLVSFTYYGKPVEYFQTNLLELPNLKDLVFASHGLEGHNEQFFINEKNIGNSDFQNLSKLQSFELNELPKLGELTMNLPKSLRRFRIAMSEVEGFSQSFEFPANLDTLILEQIGIDLDILKKLPSSIEHLELLECKTKMPGNTLDLNFPYLRCLVMNDCEIDQKTFELLNLKNFTKLKSVGFQGNKINKIDLSLFPPSVSNLSVYKNNAKIIYGENVHLPNLRNLELSENDVENHYSKTNTKFFVPEGIEWLKLRKCSLTSLDFIVWPKELGAIALDNNSYPLPPSHVESLCKRYAGSKCFNLITVSDAHKSAKGIQKYIEMGILKVSYP